LLNSGIGSTSRALRLVHVIWLWVRTGGAAAGALNIGAFPALLPLEKDAADIERATDANAAARNASGNAFIAVGELDAGTRAICGSPEKHPARSLGRQRRSEKRRDLARLDAPQRAFRVLFSGLISSVRVSADSTRDPGEAASAESDYALIGRFWDAIENVDGRVAGRCGYLPLIALGAQSTEQKRRSAAWAPLGHAAQMNRPAGGPSLPFSRSDRRDTPRVELPKRKHSQTRQPSQPV
jgi:hypothetical protein